MADVELNSTRIVQAVTNYGGVPTVMTSVQFTLYTPNMQVAVGPIVPTSASIGVYQYAIAYGTLNVPGTWSHVWLAFYSTQATQSVATFTVGEVP